MNQKNNLIQGIIKENPIFSSMLGLCPALAVTTKLENAIGMSIAFTVVLILSNLLISIIRKIIPNELRIPIFIVIIATFVTSIEMIINAYLPSIAKNLGIYLSLIVVNCIILGQAESYASKNNPINSLLNGLGIGIGYSIALCLIASIREILGSGRLTIWNDLVINLNNVSSNSQMPIFTSYFLSAAGGYLILGIMFAIINKIRKEKTNETA